MSLRRSAWIAPGIHAGLFALMWAIFLVQEHPSVVGPVAILFDTLLIADFPLSFVAFGMIWEGHWQSAMLLWGTVGTVWWYLLGLVVLWLRRKWADSRS